MDLNRLEKKTKKRNQTIATFTKANRKTKRKENRALDRNITLGTFYISQLVSTGPKFTGNCENLKTKPKNLTKFM